MKNRKLRLESLEDRCLLAVTAGAPIAYSALTGVALQKDFGPVDIDNIEANPASLGSCPCEETTTQLPAPEILTGSNGHYASYGLNRHLIQWGAVENSSGYKLEYTTDGANWTAITTTETSVIVSHLPYGANVTYRVKVRGTGSYTCSEWSGIKTFNVCPMDINGDGDISGADRTLLANAWLAEEGDERYQHYCDINGDGDISNADRAFLSNNWLAEVAEETLNYPATDELPDITDVMLVGWTGYENGQPHSITVNDPHAATDTILYSADGETYDLTKNPSFTEAGSYTVYVKVSRARYNDFTGNATVVINSVPVGDITYTLEANGQPSVNTVGKTQQDAIQTDEIGIEFAAAPVVELTLSDIELVSGGSYITLDSLTKVDDTHYTLNVTRTGTAGTGEDEIGIRITTDNIETTTKPVTTYMIIGYWGLYPQTMADNLGTAGDPIYNRPTIANILARTDKRGFTGKGPHQFIFTTDWNVEGTECTNGYVICLNSVGTVGKPTNSANIEQDEGFDPVSGDTFSGRVSWCTGYTNDQYNFTIS